CLPLRCPPAPSHITLTSTLGETAAAQGAPSRASTAHIHTAPKLAVTSGQDTLGGQEAWAQHLWKGSVLYPGDTALLDCEAAGEPRAQIFWLLPSGEMISSSTDRHSLHANGSLSISQAGLLDAGEYLCVARNPGGDDSKLYRLAVAAKPPIINGLHRNRTIMKVTAVRHSKKHIDCRAEGTPPPQIMWIMPDNIFLTAPYYGSRIVVHKNGTLEIRNIRPSDMGDFICVARNDGGETVLVVQLEVTEMLRRPMFKNPFNEKIIAKPGKPITLNCSVDGNPPPDISWMLPNGTWFSRSSGTLTIASAQSQHAGRYRCAARNQVGYIEKLLLLEVHWFSPCSGDLKESKIKALKCLRHSRNKLIMPKLWQEQTP
uniref:Ig-like domain-containing protein n=1 Tax=Zonotrichia albicollis TaxID=44394 RepID=A0A8D2MVH0_ZONAL